MGKLDLKSASRHSGYFNYNIPGSILTLVDKVPFGPLRVGLNFKKKIKENDEHSRLSSVSAIPASPSALRGSAPLSPSTWLRRH